MNNEEYVITINEFSKKISDYKKESHCKKTSHFRKLEKYINRNTKNYNSYFRLFYNIKTIENAWKVTVLKNE